MANITKNRKNIEPPRPLKSAQKSTMSTQDNQVTGNGMQVILELFILMLFIFH